MATATRSYQDVRPVRDLVTEEECYEAMVYLDQTAAEFGALQAEAKYREYMVGAAEAVGALYSDEKSADRRKYEARTSQAYLKRLEELREAERDYLTLRAKRDAAHVKIEVYRTTRADKRAREVPEPSHR
jgi:hypothetical protein